MAMGGAALETVSGVIIVGGLAYTIFTAFRDKMPSTSWGDGDDFSPSKELMRDVLQYIDRAD